MARVMALDSLYRTPESYLAAAMARAEQPGSLLTDFTTGSVTRTLFEALATVASEHSQVVDQLRKDSYLATATGDALDAKAADQGVARVKEARATGALKVTRLNTDGPLSVPAGFEVSRVPSPGVPAVTYRTTAAAAFEDGQAEIPIPIPIEATVAGAAANLKQSAMAETKVLALTPIGGLRSDGDFFVKGPIVNGVDRESDEALRARVPLEVAGRVKGRTEAFLSAALHTEGVASTSVVGPPEGSTTGLIHVYVKPASLDVLDVPADAEALLKRVTTAVLAAGMLGQTIDVAFATRVPIQLDAKLYVRDGVDTERVRRDATKALVEHVQGLGCGAPVRQSAVVQLLSAVGDVVSVDIPLTKLNRSTTPSTAVGDVTIAASEFPVLPDRFDEDGNELPIVDLPIATI